MPKISDTEFSQAILVALEEAFKFHIRKRADPSDTAIQWESVILQSPALQGLMLKGGYKPQSATDRNKFLPLVEDTCKKSAVYTMVTGRDKTTNRAHKFIRRSSPLSSIVNEETLVAELARRPAGMLMDEELLEFTFPTINAVIQKNVQEGKFLTISHSNQQDSIKFLFLADHQQKYGLSLDPFHGAYDKRMYMDICKTINQPAKEEARTVVAEEGFKMEAPEKDCNYRNISNFYELKWEWKMRQLKKKREEQVAWVGAAMDEESVLKRDNVSESRAMSIEKRG